MRPRLCTGLSMLLALQVACASLTRPSTDRLRVVASPLSSTVRLNGENRGSAPITLDVPKRERNVVEVSAPGYQTALCDTNMSPAAGYVVADIALCVLLFPIGCISFIDAGGAWNELERPHCHATLSPAERTATTKKSD